MAYRCATATANYSDTTAWLQGTNVPTLHASTNTTVNTTGVFSATFTAPNTTNAAAGVLVYLVSKGAATSITATLQEATVDTAHTQTINLSDVEAGTWIFFRPTTPYVFTAVTANRYRWKLTVNSGTASVAQASTANFAYISLDNRQAIPVSGDFAYVLKANGTAPYTITVDGTQTVGNNISSGATRSITNAVYVGPACTLAMDETASSTINHRGHIFLESTANLRCGSTGSPLNSAYTAQFIANSNNCGIVWLTGATCILQGAPKSSTTLFKSKYVSGTGTAASPLVLADPVDWDVGDELRISPGTNSGTNYNETETRFIITKNSPTSYVLSNTSGGSENALTHTHSTDTVVGNFQRNIVVKGLTTALATGMPIPAPLNAGEVDIDWVRFENLSGLNFLGAIPTNVVGITDKVELDYCVGINGTTGIFFLANNVTPATRRGLMVDNTLTTFALGPAFASLAVYNSKNLQLEDCVSFGSNGFGLGLDGSFSCTIENVEVFACNNNATNAAGIGLNGSGKNQFTNVRSNANRVNGILHNSGSANTFTECAFGSEATNGVNDVYMGAGFSGALFEDSLFGSANLIDNYLNMTAGSEIRFNRYQDTDNQHRWYDVYGHGISEPTVIRSPGLSVKLVPENASIGFTWSFKVPVVQNSIAGFRGYFLKNPTLNTDDVEIAMYLPGNPLGAGSPDASTLLANTTGAAFTDDDEQSVAMTAEYDGDIPGAAVITVNIKSNTPGAALYADDFFNAGDRSTTFDSITGLNVWSDGKPLEVISPSVPSADDTAAAVWSALLSGLTVDGTIGKHVSDLLTTDDFIALK